MATRIADTPEYELWPRVVPEGWSGTLSLQGEYQHTAFRPGVAYRCELRSLQWHASSTRKKGPLRTTLEPTSDNILQIPFAPDVGGEWQLNVETESESINSKHLPCKIGLYVLPRSQYHLRPYIGELHAHSTGSDGWQEPAYPPIRGRQFGFDFFALSDHRHYHASRQMIEALRGKLGTKMLLLAGEEMHPEAEEMSDPPAHFHYYHYVAVGQSESVRDAFLDNKESTQREVDQIADEIRTRKSVAGLDVRSYAEGVWKMRRAKQYGGFVIFCHPYWAWSLNLDETTREQTFLDWEFDAVEVLSRADSSSIMPNRWSAEWASGRRLPVVGVSDLHNWGPDSKLQHCTFVMAESLTQEGIFDAIRDNRSLAFENTGTQRFVGASDLIDFAEFYFLRILPLKRRIMGLEAEFAFAALRGHSIHPSVLQSIDASFDDLEKRLWSSD